MARRVLTSDAVTKYRDVLNGSPVLEATYEQVSDQEFPGSTGYQFDDGTGVLKGTSWAASDGQVSGVVVPDGGMLGVAARWGWRPQQGSSPTANDKVTGAIFLGDSIVPGMGIYQMDAEDWVGGDQVKWTPTLLGDLVGPNVIGSATIINPNQASTPVVSFSWDGYMLAPAPLWLDVGPGTHNVSIGFDPIGARAFQVRQFKLWVWTVAPRGL